MTSGQYAELREHESSQYDGDGLACELVAVLRVTRSRNDQGTANREDSLESKRDSELTKAVKRAGKLEAIAVIRTWQHQWSTATDPQEDQLQHLSNSALPLYVAKLSGLTTA